MSSPEQPGRTKLTNHFPVQFNSTLRHVPGAQEGDKLHAYAIAKFRDGGHAYVVLPWAKVTKIRNGSQGWQTAVKYGTTERNPWSTHEDEMAKKTAIRALAKYLPLSVEFRDAVTVDGGQADFASFAMNPSEALDAVPGDQDGEMIEAEAVQTAEDESGSQSDHEQTEQTPNEDAKPAKTRAAEAKPAKSEAIPQKKEEGAPDPADEAAAGLVARIVGDLVDCEDADAVDAVMALWEDQIATLSNAAKAQVNKAANSATNGGVNS